jgi:uncharacterized protein (TIGR03435 family)
MRLALLTFTLAVTAFGQTAPTFDVASIRTTPPGNREGGGFRRDMRTGAAVQVSPDGLIIRNSSLRSIICWAYSIFDYQLKGPDWMGASRFDINAKAAGEFPNDKLRLMLQGLLADRFKMATHTESKEMSAYILQIAKGGPKVKESTSGDGEMDIQPNQQRMQVTIVRAGVPQLIDALSNIFRAPIVDQTGLKGKYDATFDMTKYLADMKPTEGGAPPDPQAIVMRGLQEELGLKLEPKKMPVDLVIVDKAEKVPVEN